jgi:tetratricopeptide (TPR) repeat protein
MVFLSILISGALNVGCVSSKSINSDEALPPAGLSVGPASQAQSALGVSKAQLERRISKLNDRSKVLRQIPLGSVEEARLLPPVTVETDFDLWLRSEKWHEVLSRTSLLWAECIKRLNGMSAECALVGKARALSYAKLGSIESSLDIYEELGLAGEKDRSVFFARLLAARDSNLMCAQMAQVGLSVDSVESREELHSLNIRCLRRAGHSKEADKFLRVAMLEYPKSQLLLLEAALSFLSENKLTQGCDLLEQLYASNFSNVAVIYNWGQCLVRRADLEAVQTVLSRGQKEWPTEKVWLILAGDLARIEGNREAARLKGLEYLAGANQSDELRSKAENLAEM